MHRARIAELLEPFLLPCHSDRNPSAARRVEACPERSRREPAVLSPAQLNHISTYIDILQRWNARINLTSIRDEEEIVTRHFGESLFAAQHLFPRPSSAISAFSALKDFDVDSANDQRRTTNDHITVADLGSGAGFPGIPIKLWAPEIAVTLIESNHKKATFLREVIRALTLTNINVVPARAEQLSATHPTLFDVVTLRAVERFTAILPTAAALLAPGGRLALLISSSQQKQVHSALPNLIWQPPIPIPKSANRILEVVYAHHDQNHNG
jgi:16S rRNA (guanine527-N7)-methyltransferase